MADTSSSRDLLVPVDDTEVQGIVCNGFYLQGQDLLKPTNTLCLQENERALEWALEHIHKQGKRTRSVLLARDFLPVAS